MAETKTRYWYIDKRRIGIVEKSTNGITVDNITSDYISISEAKDMRIYGIAKPEGLSDSDLTSTDTPLTDIPEQFHEGIVSRAISYGYKDPRNLNIELAGYFNNEYEMCLREGKKYAKSDFRKGGTMIPYDY
jgi:hypothetical protein|tara:strand:+ start:64 stop:459 length:396 start_codon:yes stop_codon:yes gene_type:complete